MNRVSLDATPVMPPDVAQVFQRYPTTSRVYLQRLRTLIFTVSNDQASKPIEETLKWGEPSYLTKNGSTVRIAWKAKNPEQCSIYFHCQTRLVDTFKTVYGNTFAYEGNRAVMLDIDAPMPEDTLKECLSIALRYHDVKHLPLLGL